MDSFLRDFEHMKTNRSVFDAQGEEHGDIDMRLASRIEEHLRPLLGKREGSTTWFHQMDYYGDPTLEARNSVRCPHFPSTIPL